MNFTAFHEALLNAKGIDFVSGAGGNENRQRWTQAELHHKVQGNGNILIEKVYTAMPDELNPSDNFTIKLGRKQLRLITEGAEDTIE